MAFWEFILESGHLSGGSTGGLTCVHGDLDGPCTSFLLGKLLVNIHSDASGLIV